MRSSRAAVFVAVVLAPACASPDGKAVALPGGEPGLGFDDLRWSPALGRVIAPGARAGKVYLVEPRTTEVTVIDGFGATEDFSGGHDDGPTSADEGRGLLFVTDRTTRLLSVIDPAQRRILSSTPLAAGPDYVRWVTATDELWVSEPAGSQIEIFALDGGTSPRAVAAIAIVNGPESLVVDQSRGRVYTHNWQAFTMAFDVHTRAAFGRWENGCAASRGIDVEPEHGWVLTACSEGTVTVADPAQGGRLLSSVSAGAGNDVMGYARSTRHVYVAGSACGCLMVVGLSNTGSLGVLGRKGAPSDTHCAVADDLGHAWVCAPSDGELRRVDDTFPSWGAR